MKIIFLGKYNDLEVVSGPEFVARNVFYEIGKKNKDISFVQYFADGSKYSHYQKLFGSEKVIDDSNSIYRLGLFSLFVYLLKQRPDIIHIITFERFAFIAFIYRLFYKVKIFYTVHGIVCYENKTLKKGLKKNFILKDKVFETIFFTFSDLQLFLSKRSIGFAEKFFKIRYEKTVIVPNGIEEDTINQEINSINKSEKPLQIVSVASLNRPEKGIEFFLKSVKCAPFKFTAYLIGDHEESQKIVNLGIINYIPIMEHSAFIKFLSDKNIFISSSFYEPFSISALEAMAGGLVPILTKETGLSEYIEDGTHGYVINYGDTKSLLDILKQLSSDRSMLERTSFAAKEFAAIMTWGKIIERYYIPLYKNHDYKNTIEKVR